MEDCELAKIRLTAFLMMLSVQPRFSEEKHLLCLFLLSSPYFIAYFSHLLVYLSDVLFWHLTSVFIYR